MSYIDRNLRQNASYWPPGTPDGFGGVNFGAPTTIKARWEDKAVLFIDRAGVESRARARIYVNQDVELRGYIYLGVSASTDPTTVDGAYEIRDFRKTPNLQATEFERRVLI